MESVLQLPGNHYPLLPGEVCSRVLEFKSVPGSLSWSLLQGPGRENSCDSWTSDPGPGLHPPQGTWGLVGFHPTRLWEGTRLCPSWHPVGGASGVWGQRPSVRGCWAPLQPEGGWFLMSLVELPCIHYCYGQKTLEARGWRGSLLFVNNVALLVILCQGLHHARRGGLSVKQLGWESASPSPRSFLTSKRWLAPSRSRESSCFKWRS